VAEATKQNNTCFEGLLKFARDDVNSYYPFPRFPGLQPEGQLKSTEGEDLRRALKMSA